MREKKIRGIKRKSYNRIKRIEAYTMNIRYGSIFPIIETFKLNGNYPLQLTGKYQVLKK